MKEFRFRAAVSGISKRGAWVNSFTKLWGCSTGTDPITDSATLGSVAKVRDQGPKSRKSA